MEGFQEGLDTSSENDVFMVEIEEIIEPFIPSLKRIGIEAILPAVLDKAHKQGLTHIEEGELQRLLSVHITPVATPVKADIPADRVRPTIDLGRYKSRFTTRKLHGLAELFNKIVAIVNKSGHGITKTAILQELRKDNSYWRPKITAYLLDLCDMQVIQTDNGREPRYYPYHAYVQNREREVHRRIVETLQIHGQMTMTQIAIKIGRNGGSNRNEVKLALEDLRREGFIRLGERSRWAWIA